MLRPNRGPENPNTISNFSQSWQRAAQLQEPVSQHEQFVVTVSEFPQLHESHDQFNGERSTLHRLSFVSNRSGYGTITHGEHRDLISPVPFHRHTDIYGEAAGDFCAVEEKSVVEDEEGHVCLLGKSTVPMTIFNCTNMLVGIGILALPLALRQCGWAVGLALLTLPAIVTAYTAKLLVRCLNTEPTAVTYGDIAYLAFGPIGRHVIEILFLFELIAANVALVLLFADSVTALTPVFSSLIWKVIFAIGLIPLNFAPLRFLSVSSAIGIFCFIGVFTLIITSGLSKPDTPGSLLQLASTRIFPQDWRAVPATFGIFMAPWGGHSIVPALYKDMRHPEKYDSALKYSYSITYSLALLVGVLGYVMFGDGVCPEITSNILAVREYPAAIPVMMILLVTVVPLTKLALTNRPVMDTVNRKFGIDRDSSNPESDPGVKAHGLGRIAVGALCNVLQLALAILIPNFDDVVAFMGSILCITICIVLPGCFYLKICSDRQMEVSLAEKVACWLLILVGTACAVAGLFFALLQAY